MTRLRLGFPLLVAILLILFLMLAPNFLWSRTPEADTQASSVTQLGLTNSNQEQAASPLQVTSPLPTPTVNLLPTPTPIPLSPPSGYIQADGAIDQRRPRIYIVFDRPMDQESVARALLITPPVATVRTWSENRLDIEPATLLRPGEQLTVRLTTDATDSKGTHLAAEMRYDHWVPPLAATITAHAVAGDEEPVMIQFNYAMNGESVLEALRIEPSIPGNIQWDEAGQRVLIYAAAPLMANRAYTFRFEGELLDSEDRVMLPLPSQSLVTGPPFMQTSYAPTHHPAISLRLVFDRAMDAATTAAALTLSPPVSVTQGWMHNTLILTPTSGAFVANTTYQITLQPTATDADGNFLLDTPYESSFQVGAATLLGDFGIGPNVQVLLADGARTIQYQATPMPMALTHHFELYALTPAQFINHYANGYALMNGSGPTPISVEGAELVATWQTEGRVIGYGGGIWGGKQETLLPADVPPGLYVLNMKIGSLQAQLFVVLTHHTVAVKQGVDEVVAWLTDGEGKPSSDAALSFYDADGALITTATTDEEGLVRVPIEQGATPLLLLAQVDDGEGADEVTVAGFDSGWGARSSAWSWGWAPPLSANNRAFAVHLYTERPIYQPGQTLYYKAIIRNDDDALLTLPAPDTTVLVRLRDARNNVVRTITHSLNAFGALDGKFNLAEGAMVGEYKLEAEIDGEIHDYRFEVQEYRKPDFTVEATTTVPTYTDGNDVALQVESRYLWGEPVVNAQVSWRPFYRGQDNYVLYMDSSMDGSIVSSTDAAGNANFTFTASTVKNWRDYVAGFGSPEGKWGVEVTVEDEGHQSVSTSALLHFGKMPEQIEISAPDFQLVNQPFTVGITVTDEMGKPVAGKAIQVAIGREIVATMSAGVEYTTVVTTSAQGHVQVPLTLPELGYYHLWLNEPTITRADGRVEANPAALDTYASDMISSIDPQNAPADANAPYTPFAVLLDRTTYLPGDEAQITILSRFAGPALISMERGEVRRTQMVELTPPKTIVTTTILAEDAPNLYVTVNGWEATATITSTEAKARFAPFAPDLSHSDAYLHSDKVELRVPVLDKTLLVTLTADQAHYTPRQKATFTVTVTDQAGEPVEAELSLALVDEAIFLLAADQSGSLFDAFYEPRPHSVDAYDSMAPTRFFGGGRGGGGGDGRFTGLLRHDFRDTVAWLPSVETDADGIAQVTLTLPDNLTTWRLTAKAITGESTQVGEATTTITTWQPLVVRPLLPHGVTAGDEATLSATLHNQSEQEQEATIWLAAASSQLQVGGTPTQTVMLAPGEVRVIGWPVTATAAGTVSVTIASVATGVGGVAALYDAVESALPIQPLAIAERSTQVGHFDELWETALNVPEDVLPMSHLRIELNRSVAGSFVSGLEYLTGFPYGCVEQTMSRALPNAVVSRAFHLLEMDTSILHPDLPGLVNVGVQRLYGFQHADGGWGWWYDDATHDYQTAWVIYGLAMTAQSGYEVDPAVIERGVAWLLPNLYLMDQRTQAFALYSIALALPLLPTELVHNGSFVTPPSPLERVRGDSLPLLEVMDQLDAFSLAALALALHSVDESDAVNRVMKRLLAGVTEEEESAYWALNEPDGYYQQKTMASATRSTALALSALLQIDPDHPLVPKIAAWMMAQRQQYGWGTTNETAFALVALTDYLLATTQTEGGNDFVIEINGEEIASGTLDNENTNQSLVISLEQLTPGENQIRLRQSGDNPLYYKVSQDFSVGQTSLEAAGNVVIDRHYEDASTGQIRTSLAPGEMVRVVMTVRMDTPGFYMLVEDGVPGGLEPLNESLNTTSYIATTGETPLYNQEYGYNYKEVLGDRVRFFITELPAGEHRFSYLARATHSGRFVALPTEAWAMYNTQLWGRSASQEVTIEP